MSVFLNGKRSVQWDRASLVNGTRAVELTVVGMVRRGCQCKSLSAYFCLEHEGLLFARGMYVSFRDVFSQAST